MKLHPASLLLPSLLFVWAWPAQGQDEMITDRPDQSESTAIVGRGVFQLETGITIERDESALVVQENREWAGSLLRWGLSERFELRFGFTGYTEAVTEVADGKTTASGLGDAELGFKLRLRDGQGRSPAIAFLAATTLPVGEEGLSSERYDPTVRFAFDHELGDALGLGWNVGYRRESAPGPAGVEHQDYVLYSASLGISAGERWGTYFELFGDVAAGGSGEDSHSFDTGITYLLTPDLQLDLEAGLGLNGAAPDTFFGFGVSWRRR